MKNTKTSYSGFNSSEFYTNNSRTQGSRITILGLLQSFVIQLFRAIPFSAQVFLRKGIGSMTFSWVSILFAALWVRYILDGTYQLDELAPPDTYWYEWFNKGNGFQYYFAAAFWYVGIFFQQFWGIITDFIPADLWNPSRIELSEILPFFISLGVLIFGAIHKWRIKQLHDQRIVFDPMSKGKSLLFEGLINQINPKNRERVMAFLEIGALLALALFMYILSAQNAGWIDYAGLFFAGAVGIGIEEWRAELQQRREIEIRFANEFKAIKLQTTYQEYQKDVQLLPATVSFIGYPLSASEQVPNIAPTVYYQSENDGPNRFTRLSPKYLFAGAFLIVIVLAASRFMSNEKIEMVGIVQTENLTVRAKPRLTATSIGTISQGAVVQAYETFFDNTGRQWCKLLHKGKKAYAVAQGTSGTSYIWTDDISSYSLTFLEVPFEDIIQTNSGSNLNLRSSPALDAPVLTKIPDGTKITVLEEVSEPQFLEMDGQLIFGSWVLASYLGYEGYCFSWYLEGCRIP